LCDVAISTSSGKIFMAHKAILASCSEYFETMFLAEVKYNFMADTANF